MPRMKSALRINTNIEDHIGTLQNSESCKDLGDANNISSKTMENSLEPYEPNLGWLKDLLSPDLESPAQPKNPCFFPNNINSDSLYTLFSPQNARTKYPFKFPWHNTNYQQKEHGLGFPTPWISASYHHSPPQLYYGNPRDFQVQENKSSLRVYNGWNVNTESWIWCDGKPYNGSDDNDKDVAHFEHELQELLKGRRKPLRISMLPSMYEDRFRRPFNKSNQKLTTLLSHCKNIILIYRPDGQHVIMLKERAEEGANKRSRGKGKECLDPQNRKIYLTFPPGSKFTTEDAEMYFKQFGGVRGIRMSTDDPPTYAFVEFYFADGALSALCSNRAHYICGQKVMVKPYKHHSN